MPFKSEKQRKFMFAKHPKIARKWAHEGGGDKLKKSKKSKKSHGSSYFGSGAKWA